MDNMKEIICKCGCGRKKMVRIADIKRGWGKFFSKSCKAYYQENRTGQYKKYKMKTIKTIDGMVMEASDTRISDQEHDEIMAECELGWDDHKDI